jgi:hypothetical protein
MFAPKSNLGTLLAKSKCRAKPKRFPSPNGRKLANMITRGQALDVAIKDHETLYPGSWVYRADVTGKLILGTGRLESLQVELLASHFSVPLVYCVPIA